MPRGGLLVRHGPSPVREVGHPAALCESSCRCEEYPLGAILAVAVHSFAYGSGLGIFRLLRGRGGTNSPHPVCAAEVEVEEARGSRRTSSRRHPRPEGGSSELEEQESDLRRGRASHKQTKMSGKGPLTESRLPPGWGGSPAGSLRYESMSSERRSHRWWRSDAEEAEVEGESALVLALAFGVRTWPSFPKNPPFRRGQV